MMSNIPKKGNDLNDDDDLPKLLDGNWMEILCQLYRKLTNIAKIIIGHLNVNSLRNKFDALESIIPDNIDIFVISETKLDESFSVDQLEIDGFSTPFRIDRNKEGGGGASIEYNYLSVLPTTISVIHFQRDFNPPPPPPPGN